MTHRRPPNPEMRTPRCLLPLRLVDHPSVPNVVPGKTQTRTGRLAPQHHQFIGDLTHCRHNCRFCSKCGAPRPPPLASDTPSRSSPWHIQTAPSALSTAPSSNEASPAMASPAASPAEVGYRTPTSQVMIIENWKLNMNILEGGEHETILLYCFACIVAIE